MLLGIAELPAWSLTPLVNVGLSCGPHRPAWEDSVLSRPMPTGSPKGVFQRVEHPVARLGCSSGVTGLVVCLGLSAYPAGWHLRKSQGQQCQGHKHVCLLLSLVNIDRRQVG